MAYFSVLTPEELVASDAVALVRGRNASVFIYLLVLAYIYQILTAYKRFLFVTYLTKTSVLQNNVDIACTPYVAVT